MMLRKITWLLNVNWLWDCMHTYSNRWLDSIYMYSLSSHKGGVYCRELNLTLFCYLCSLCHCLYTTDKTDYTFNWFKVIKRKNFWRHSRREGDFHQQLERAKRTGKTIINICLGISFPLFLGLRSRANVFCEERVKSLCELKNTLTISGPL